MFGRRYNLIMQEPRSHLPSADQIGVLTASVLLAFALTRLIQSPQFTLTISLPGFYFALPLTLGSLMNFIAAGLAAAGMEWLTRGHAALGGRSNIEHLLLPTLTTFVTGSLLTSLPNGTLWWSAFALVAFLLAAIFLAEYITIDPSTPVYGFARAGLTALGYVLFLILASSLRFSGARMFLMVPSIFVVALLISLRLLHLDGRDRWDFPWAVGIGLVCAQTGAGLHYWPLTQIQFGVALTGLLYALSLLATALSEDIPLRRAAVGPTLILGAAWISAFLLGQ